MSLRYDCVTPVAGVEGLGCLAGHPFLAVCRYACHQLLPLVRVTFAMGPDAALPGSDQWTWSTAPATGLAGPLGRPSASDPGGVVHCALFLCRPRCLRVCGVLATWRLVTVSGALCVPCAVSVATWHLFTGVHAVCAMCVLVVAS